METNATPRLAVPFELSEPTPPQVGSRRSRYLKTSLTMFLSFLLLVVVVLLWEGVIKVFHEPSYILPSPDAVASALGQDATSSVFWANVRVTMTEILAGFGIGVVCGTLLALLMVSSALLEKVSLPYIIAFQAMPKIALAPLMIVWFGFGITSKIVVTALVAFFPVFMNVLAGFKNVDSNQLLLMRSIRATRVQVLFKLRLPAVVPYLMAGLDIAIVLAVIGAVVAEFVGSSQGLGSLIVQRQSSVDIAGVMSALVFLSLIGVVLHLVVAFLGRPFVSWSRDAR